MLVDFCHWCLQTAVSCDKPSCDGYEVQNLISKDLTLHRKGFLAANFIKPPVNITFQFPCKISIHHVLINPIVGAQKSTSVEIYTSCKRISSSWLFSEESVQASTRGRLTFDSPLFINIGKVSLNEPSKVCFTYPRFVASAPFSPEPVYLEGCVTSELHNSRYQYLTAVSQLTLRIVRTSGSCIPALKSIQIIGQPAGSCGREILEKVYKIYRDCVYPVVVKQEDKSQIETNKEEVIVDTGLQIPDEFLDPITCDIMALPVLLPSGKSLDQSTLEKYISTESSWGRGPSDPFTGVLFSAESRPIPNDSLKVRIDAFLFKNANDDKLKTVARTVGRNNQTCRTQMCKPHDQPSISSLTSRNSVKRPLVTESNIGPKTKKIKTDKVDLKLASVTIKSEPRHQGTSHADKSQLKGVNSSHQNDISASGTSHERQLDNSLTQAMSLLNGLPSFTKKSKTDLLTAEPDNKHCVNCSSLMDQSTVAYKLQCSHVVCRPCIVQGGTSVKSVQCGHCKASTLLSDITRAHMV